MSAERCERCGGYGPVQAFSWEKHDAGPGYKKCPQCKGTGYRKDIFDILKKKVEIK